MVDMVSKDDLAIDLEAIFQAAFGPEGGFVSPSTVTGNRTDELMPGMVIWTPNPDDKLGMTSVPRTVEIAYHEEEPDPKSPTGFTRGRWLVLFSDGLKPRGFQTSASRLWAIPEEVHQVVAGIEFLDREFPNWWWRIDPDGLDMASSSACMLGQIHGEGTGCGVYEEIAADLFGNTEAGARRAETLGFHVTIDEVQDQRYRVLTMLWQSVLRDRRKTHPQVPA